MKTQPQHIENKKFAKQLIENLRKELIIKYPKAIYYGMDRSKHGFAKTGINPAGNQTFKKVDEYINFTFGKGNVYIKIAISGLTEDDFFDYHVYYAHRVAKGEKDIYHDLGTVTNFNMVARMFEKEMAYLLENYC